MNARDHIRNAEEYARDLNTRSSDAIAEALIAIAVTLADMADMDADTRTQPAVRPPTPPPDYSLYHPGDTERIPT